MSGSLVVYSMHVTWKAIVKIAAHAGDASSLDWHPTRPYVIATGGSGDRCVKGKNTKRTESVQILNTLTGFMFQFGMWKVAST